MNGFSDLEQHGQALAIHHDSTGWIDYVTLASMADASVSGLGARTLFALEFSATPQCVATYLGALRHAHVPLLVDAQLDAGMKESLYDHFGIRRVFGEGGWRVRAHAAPEPELHSALGLLMSTSGSTGSPKLVRLSTDNLQANARSIVEFMALTTASRAITSLPLNYSYGLSVLNSHLFAGASIVLSDKAVTTAAFWETFRTHEVTGLGGVPTTWQMLRRMRFERMALPSLRLMTQAGGRLDPDDVRWLAGVAGASERRLFIMYGQTEATARIAYLAPQWLPSKAGSIGSAIPGGTLEIVDAQGRPVTASGEEGELAYRGPNVMLGYAESPADLASGITVDQLRTGDLGYRDEDGLHWITGRIKRFIKLFGNRFNLDEVEAHVRGRGLDAGVVGRDDLLMIAACAPPDALTNLRTELADYYRVHPSVIRVTAVEVLPRNSAGKLLHAALLAQLERQDGEGRP